MGRRGVVLSAGSCSRRIHFAEFDVTICALFGGSLRVIADITEAHLIEKILGHIKQTRAPPVRVQPRTHSTPSNPQTRRSR